MTMVDWLLTEQLVEIFSEARAKRPGLNVELLGRSPLAESDLLGGAGISARIDARDGAVLLVTPRRIARLIGDDAADLVVFTALVGYDWISTEMSEKVELKSRYFDRLYLYPRAAPPVILDRLGDAVYPLMTFLGRVLEYRSQKVLLPRLDADVVDIVGRCLQAAAHGPFFTDADLEVRVRRDRDSMRAIAAMWPRMNLAAPELPDLVERIARALIESVDPSSEDWSQWIGVRAHKLLAVVDVFGRVVSGDV